ncbi:hypothetical protein [Pleomorphomonas sp. PLEO]|uniref:hypothetical protein n=1 Tax=Pleomorphomonas sp. PLEO TaxID=3239306 RepID=UPI00351DBCFB
MHLMRGAYRNVLFRLDGVDYLAKALIFIPGLGEKISLEKDGQFREFRVVAMAQTAQQVVVGIEEIQANA